MIISSFSVNSPMIREINEVTKYDSLEVLYAFSLVSCVIHKILFYQDIARSPAFIPLVSIEDVQAIRSVSVHPTGKYFAVGSNSKMLRVCAYPDLKNIRSDSIPKPAKVLYKRGKHHLGSIYCMGWSPSGKLIATGSNDKLIKIVRLNMDRPDDDLNSKRNDMTEDD